MTLTLKPLKPKNNFEIRAIKKSCKIVSDILHELENIIKPGITTFYINEFVSNLIEKNNAKSACLNYFGFPKSICTSINEKICHGIPSENEFLKDGDIIGIDVSIHKNGFYGDSCFTYPVGEISDEDKKLLFAARESLKVGVAEALPNKYISDIGYAIRLYVENLGYGIVREFIGHGIGTNLHESPQVNHYSEYKNIGNKIIPNITFTIEPMINQGVKDILILEDGWTAITKDNKKSAQYEQTILITENGNEILTNLPDHILNYFFN